jgi:hypothetical protein
MVGSHDLCLNLAFKYIVGYLHSSLTGLVNTWYGLQCTVLLADGSGLIRSSGLWIRNPDPDPGGQK